VLASSFGHLHQPLFSSQRAVLSQLKCAQRACEIFWDFNIRKWPLNLSQKMAEKNMSILVWFKWCSSAAWACLKPFDWFWGKNKITQNFAFPQGHFLKAGILPMKPEENDHIHGGCWIYFPHRTVNAYPEGWG
jgi:hypothetical protein